MSSRILQRRWEEETCYCYSPLHTSIWCLFLQFSPSSRLLKNRKQYVKALIHSKFRCLSKAEVVGQLDALLSSVVQHSPRNRGLQAVSVDVSRHFPTRKEKLRVIEFYHFTMKVCDSSNILARMFSLINLVRSAADVLWHARHSFCSSMSSAVWDSTSSITCFRAMDAHLGISRATGK